jgi:hypothetical protein
MSVVLLLDKRGAYPREVTQGPLAKGGSEGTAPLIRSISPAQRPLSSHQPAPCIILTFECLV